MQINVAEVDESGKMIQGKNVTYAFSGFVRSMGESDDSLNMLATQDGCKSAITHTSGGQLSVMSSCLPVLKNTWSYEK